MEPHNALYLQQAEMLKAWEQSVATLKEGSSKEAFLGKRCISAHLPSFCGGAK